MSLVLVWKVAEISSFSTADCIGQAACLLISATLPDDNSPTDDMLISSSHFVSALLIYGYVLITVYMVYTQMQAPSLTCSHMCIRFAQDRFLGSC